MLAIDIPHYGGPEVLTVCTRPVPQPGEKHILVRVEAAGVNRPDILQRQGIYPPPMGAPQVPGLEIAGTVAALGAGATRFSIGDKVCALVPGGGYAAWLWLNCDDEKTWRTRGTGASTISLSTAEVFGSGYPPVHTRRRMVTEKRRRPNVGGIPRS